MTTIACNLKEMAADTRVVWEGIGSDAYSGIKLYPSKRGGVLGVTGGNCTGALRAVEWLQQETPSLEHRPQPPTGDHGWDWKIIELTPQGIAVYNEILEREPIMDDVMAVGSGRKVALYCMKYLGMSPAQAVYEASKVDEWSDAPVFSVSLSDPKVVRWVPPVARKRKS